MKYENLAAVVAAYKAGELTDPITLDNDSTSLWAGEEDEEEVVFDGGTPHDLLVQALNLLGVPWVNA